MEPHRKPKMRSRKVLRGTGLCLGTGLIIYGVVKLIASLSDPRAAVTFFYIALFGALVILAVLRV